MIAIPNWLLMWLIKLGMVRKPDYLLVDLPDAPDDADLTLGIMFREVRSGYPKWLHFVCPRCREHIQIPLVGRTHWTVRYDLFRRPTVHPSIWQTGSCKAHFFVRSGMIQWCPD